LKSAEITEIIEITKSVCSPLGQSKMQMTVILIFNATEEIANAVNYPKIRLYSRMIREAQGLIFLLFMTFWFSLEVKM
jgi:hypothetical protein